MKRKTEELNLKEKFDLIGAAILGLLGPEAQKLALEKIGENAKKAFNDPNPLLKALREKRKSMAPSFEAKE